MKNIDQFIKWFQESIQDKQKLESEANAIYQDVCENTLGWASVVKCYILHKALIAMDDDEYYLEIGSYTGRSLVGALLNNDKIAHVIDPFELFLPDGITIYNEWLKAVKRYKVYDRVVLHKALCQNFNSDLPPIGVFYYDGNHDSGHTYEGLKKFESYLRDKAIILVDDYSIFGGFAQTPFPGHDYIVDDPVKVDVDKWLKETANAELISVIPWENHTAIIKYERI